MSELKNIKDLEIGDIVENEYGELAEITEIEEPGLFRCIDKNDDPNVIDIRELARSKNPEENQIEVFNYEDFENEKG